MDFPYFPLRGTLLAGQLILIAFGLSGLYLAPPAQGQMLLVPLSADARTLLVPTAVGHGARLVAAGPYAGSVVVAGDRALLAMPLLGRAILPLSAKAMGCGDAA